MTLRYRFTTLLLRVLWFTPWAWAATLSFAIGAFWAAGDGETVARLGSACIASGLFFAFAWRRVLRWTADRLPALLDFDPYDETPNQTLTGVWTVREHRDNALAQVTLIEFLLAFCGTLIWGFGDLAVERFPI